MINLNKFPSFFLVRDAPDDNVPAALPGDGVGHVHPPGGKVVGLSGARSLHHGAPGVDLGLGPVHRQVPLGTPEQD